MKIVGLSGFRVDLQLPDQKSLESAKKSIKRNNYYYRDTVEPDRYINNVEKFELRLTTKDK